MPPVIHAAQHERAGRAGCVGCVGQRDRLYRQRHLEPARLASGYGHLTRSRPQDSANFMRFGVFAIMHEPPLKCRAPPPGAAQAVRPQKNYFESRGEKSMNYERLKKAPVRSHRLRVCRPLSPNRPLNPPNRRVRDPYARWCGRGGAARLPPLYRSLVTSKDPATEPWERGQHNRF